MAVIREQRRFQMGNINVVRASDAGERAAVSAMQNADKLINMAFDGASKEAKRKGIQLAKSLDEVKEHANDICTNIIKASDEGDDYCEHLPQGNKLFTYVKCENEQLPPCF